MGCGPSKGYETEILASEEIREKVSLNEICFVREVTDENVHDVYDFTGPVLGSGSFATVLRVKNKKSGRGYAMKQINLKDLKDDPQMMRMLNNEIETMKMLSHPNIVRLQEVYRPKKQDMLYLVLDSLDGGSVNSLLKHAGRLEEKHAAYIITQIVDAVRSCHSMNIAHRDLKLANCMFEDSSATPIVKVIDFGLCREFKDGQTSSAFVGTMTFAAPEVVAKDQGHALACDIWAIGVMTYVLVSGELPFTERDPNKLAQQIVFEKQEYRDKTWEGVSSECRDFIDKCLVKDPAKRITAIDAQKHPWTKKAGKAMTGAPLSKASLLSMMSFQETNAFEKLAMELVAYSCEPSQIRDLERQFREMDTNGSGRVSLSEFKEAMKARLKSITKERAAGHGAGGEAPANAPPSAARDGNEGSSAGAEGQNLRGQVNASEGGQARGGADSEIFSRVGEEALEDLFAAIDADGCGGININEFVAACMAKREINGAAIKAAFERLDYNMSGMISVADVVMYLGDAVDKEDIEQHLREVSSRDDGRVNIDDFTMWMKEHVFSSRVGPPSKERSQPQPNDEAKAQG